MEKTVIIDGKEVRFKATAALPKRYKSQFGKDFFVEIFKMGALYKLDQALQGKDPDQIKPDEIDPQDLEGLDLDFFYDIAWCMAKTADPSIPDPLTWLDQFEVFPMGEILPQLQDLINQNFAALKKSR